PVSSCPILLYTLPPVLPSPLLSPYTPLFRSDRGARVAQHARSARSRRHTAPAVHGRRDDRHGQALAVRDGGWRGALGEARRGGVPAVREGDPAESRARTARRSRRAAQRAQAPRVRLRLAP